MYRCQAVLDRQTVLQAASKVAVPLLPNAHLIYEIYGQVSKTGRAVAEAMLLFDTHRGQTVLSSCPTPSSIHISVDAARGITSRGLSCGLATYGVFNHPLVLPAHAFNMYVILVYDRDHPQPQASRQVSICLCHTASGLIKTHVLDEPLSHTKGLARIQGATSSRPFSAFCSVSYLLLQAYYLSFFSLRPRLAQGLLIISRINFGDILGLMSQFQRQIKKKKRAATRERNARITSYRGCLGCVERTEQGFQRDAEAPGTLSGEGGPWLETVRKYKRSARSRLVDDFHDSIPGFM